MYDGYWDDYMNDGADNTPTKDCVKNIYRVYKDGKLLKEGQNARKQVLHKEHSFTKGQMKRFNNNDKLKELGYTISVRKWNVTNKKWETEKFATI